ncbi:LOW QUALITY PROTEIN: hypothetical protein MC885_007544 [Smutsia gigantea]|nr:LOW QUALITY PROTEIN: hypothetical protein MC885_007544 [Smutsia gigantea]
MNAKQGRKPMGPHSTSSAMSQLEKPPAVPSSGWGPRCSRPGPARTPAAKRAAAQASGARTPSRDQGLPRAAPPPLLPPGFSRQLPAQARARAPAAAAVPPRCSSWSPWRHAARGARAPRSPGGRRPARRGYRRGLRRQRLLCLPSASRPRLVRLVRVRGASWLSEDKEKLKRQGRARLSPGKRKLPDRLLVEAGRGTRGCWRKCPSLHHVPNKQLGHLGSYENQMDSCCCQTGRSSGREARALLVSKAGMSGCRVSGRSHIALPPATKKADLKLQYRWVEKSAKTERKDVIRKQGDTETKGRKDYIGRKLKSG